MFVQWYTREYSHVLHVLHTHDGSSTLSRVVQYRKDTIVGEKRPRRFKQKDQAKLTLLGRYFVIVCKRLHMTWDQVAREAGIDPSTISKGMAQGGNQPQYSTLEKMVDAMSKHKGWLHRFEKTMFNLNRSSTREQFDEAVQDLIRMEYIYEKYGPDYENSLEEHEPPQDGLK